VTRPRREIERELEQSGVWDQLSVIGDSPLCIGCGCTERDPCLGGCAWVALDVARNVGLCSSCVVIPIDELLARSQQFLLQLAALEQKTREILTK
jgi:hypothetical protein